MAEIRFNTGWLTAIGLTAKCGTPEEVMSLCVAIQRASLGEDVGELSPLVELLFNPILEEIEESRALSETRKRSGSEGGKQKASKAKQNDSKSVANRSKSVANLQEKERETEEDREEESRESKEASPHTPLEENKESKGEEIEEDKEKEREYIRAYTHEETALSVDVLPSPAFVPENDPKRLTDKMLEEEFDALWMLYPRKSGKADALRHYKAARRQGVAYDAVEDGIKRYADYVKDEDPKFIAMGSTWFCGHRWEDQYARGKPKVGSIEWIANL